jgi:hypothetical protein
VSFFCFAPFLSFFRYFRPGREYDLDETLKREIKSWARHIRPPEDSWECILRRIETEGQGKIDGPFRFPTPGP